MDTRMVSVSKSGIVPFIGYLSEEETARLGAPGFFALGAVTDFGQGEMGSGILSFSVNKNRVGINSLKAYHNEKNILYALLSEYIRVCESASVKEADLNIEDRDMAEIAGEYLKSRNFRYSRNGVVSDVDLDSVRTEKIKDIKDPALKALDPECFRDKASMPGTFILASYQGNSRIPLAMAVVTEDRDRSTIEWLSVGKEYRNKGLGKKLVNKAKELASDRGCNDIAVHLTDDKSQKYFEKLGFTNREDECKQYGITVSMIPESISSDRVDTVEIALLSELNRSETEHFRKYLEKEKGLLSPLHVEEAIDLSDRKLSHVWINDSGIQAVLLVRTCENRIYPFFFNSENSKCGKAVITEALIKARDLMPAGSNIKIICTREASEKVVEGLDLPFSHVNSWCMVQRL